MKKKISLSDVDGTVPGRAALIMINLENPDEHSGFMYQLFVESRGMNVDPHVAAQALWESIKVDGPNHSHTIVLNERARYLMAARRMRELTGGDFSPEDYLEGKA